MTLRTPSLTWERSKITVLIVGYSALAEYVDPAAFYSSTFGRFLWLVLGLELIRQFWVAGLEGSLQHVQRTQDMRTRWERLKARFTINTRFRIRRALGTLTAAYFFGLILSTLTTRCDGALECVLLAPIIALENLPMFLQIMLMIFFSMAQLVIMMVSLTKVGFVKLILPGTIQTTFADIFGQDPAVAIVQEQIDLLESADAIEAAGGYMPKGLLIWGPPGTGKTMLAKAAANASTKPLIILPPGAFASPQPLYTPVLTPTGWTTMGEIAPGDEVLGRDGLPTQVLGVYDRGEDVVYQVTFDDGASTECTLDHLWTVKTDEGWHTEVSLAEILDRGLSRPHGSDSKSWRFAIPLAERLEFGAESSADLPLHPYVLGALLGDGSFRGTSTMMKAEKRPAIVTRMLSLLPEWMAPLAKENPSAGNAGAWHFPALHHIIRYLELDGIGSFDKFVPSRYLQADAPARLEMLRGLMDTDGSTGYPRFTSRSFILANNVAYLARSLGGKASVTRYDHEGAPLYSVSLSVRNNPFWVEDKAAGWIPRTQDWVRSMVDVREVGTTAVRCLLVDNEDHLYVTEDFILTHNTFVGINLLKVAMLFRMIRKFSMRHGGVIVFFDEIDSLGNRGSDVVDQAVPAHLGCVVEPSRSQDHIVIGGGGQDAGTLTAFLSAMDGMEEARGMLNRLLALLGFAPLAPPKYRYLMIGATNRPDALDAALTRAGRFGRQVHMGYPKFSGKLATFIGYLSKVDNDISTEDVEWAARNLHRGTGASIQDIVNEALLIAFRDDRTEIDFDDLLSAMLWKELGEGEGLQELDEDNWAVAIHEAGHAVTTHHLRSDYLRIWVGSIERRGQYGGLIANTEVAERDFKPYEAMIADIAVSLASRVAEQLVLDTMGNGHMGDGPAATDLADTMLRGGHGTTLSALYQEERTTDGYEWEIENLLRVGYNLAVETLEVRIPQIEAVAQLLIDEDGTVQGDKIHAVIDKLEEERIE